MRMGARRGAAIAVAALIGAATWSLVVPTHAAGSAVEAPVEVGSWPEAQREFWLGAPGLLLSEDWKKRFLAADESERDRLMTEFLGTDPVAATPENELTEGIRRRLLLADKEFLTFLDDRARMLFLHGAPSDRQRVDCDQTFKPIEIWTYAGQARRLIFYEPSASQPYRLWLPLDSKRVLYSTEMEYWLEQFHELRRYIRGRRFDLQLCRYAATIDDITGIDGLFSYRADRPSNNELLGLLAAPADLAAWSKDAAATPLLEVPDELRVESIEVVYPERKGQRMVARMTVLVPTGGANLKAFEEDEGKSEYRVQVEGVIETEGEQFEDFRMRFEIDASTQPDKVALVIDRALRPDRLFQARLRVRDEIGGAQEIVAVGLDVPEQPQAVPELPVPDNVVVSLGDRLAEQKIPGRDDIVLVPPETDVVLGLWRADTLVSGDRIQSVKFLVDGDVQFTRSRPPFSAELRLSKYPREQLIRVEGYDAQDQLVDSDELLINQQRGELKVRITQPERGKKVRGKVMAVAEVTVPEEQHVTKVEFLVNEDVQAVRQSPPWQAEVQVPEVVSPDQVTYLTVVAELDNGLRAEDVRFLNAPEFLDQVEVELVELYTTVTDNSQRLVPGLTVDDFQVKEDGRPQKIAKFELVEDLPLTIGITIDTSGSMMEALGEARRAAIDFLDNIVTPKDRTFAVSFSDRPELLMPRTSDVGAVAQALEQLKAVGSTALHDAVVTSLYYFRGVRGRRALILLSDGEDTSSTIPYRDALEYARRSGVAIYTIGLDIGRLQIEVRKKLKELADTTGGRAFFINRAEELRSVYGEIDHELRSQYLLAYSSDRPGGDSGQFREVEVVVKGGRLKARTLRGYYP